MVFGTPPKKLYRRKKLRKDFGTSQEAAESINTTTLEREALRVIAKYDGCISDDVRADFGPGYAYSSVTARFAALIDKGLITRGPDCLKGDSGRRQGVLRITRLGDWHLDNNKD